MPEELEELNLWDYVIVLRKRIWVVLTVFLAATAISMILSFLVLPPIYEARVSLMIGEPETLGLPKWSLETYSNILKSPDLIRDVAVKVGLTEKPQDVEGLAQQAQAEVVKDTNILKLKVRGKSPEEVAQLANTWSDLFISRVNQLKKAELDQTLQVTAASITALSGELARTAPTVRLKRSITDEPALYETVRDRMKEVTPEIAGLEMTVEEPNPRYLDIAAQLTNKRLSIEDLKTTAGLLKNNPQICVKVVSPAMEPAGPVAPRKLLNTAVAAMLGLMVGVMLAFLIEALEVSAIKNSKHQPEGVMIRHRESRSHA